MDDDELACLKDDAPHAGGAGCSAQWGAEAGVAGLEPPGDSRALALLLTLCPPLALSVANPDAFLGALENASAPLMTLLYGVLPPIMAWQLRRKLQGRLQQRPGGEPDAAPTAAEAAVDSLQQQWLLRPEEAVQDGAQPQALPCQPWWRVQHEEMVPGGAPVLACLFSAAFAIALSRLAVATGLASGDGAAASGEFVQVSTACLPPCRDSQPRQCKALPDAAVCTTGGPSHAALRPCMPSRCRLSSRRSTTRRPCRRPCWLRCKALPPCKLRHGCRRPRALTAERASPPVLDPTVH